MTYKLVYLARRAATVAREDWPRTWKSHAVFASQFPALEAKIDWMRYCNRAEVYLPDLSLAHDGVAVAAGESLAGLTGGVLSDEDRVRIDADELRVFDMLTPNFTWFCEEELLREGPLGEAAIFRFSPERRNTAIPDGAVRHAINHPVSNPLPLFPYVSIAESWFCSLDDAVVSLRDDARQGDLTVLTTVCHRWPKS